MIPYSQHLRLTFTTNPNPGSRTHNGSMSIGQNKSKSCMSTSSPFCLFKSHFLSFQCHLTSMSTSSQNSNVGPPVASLSQADNSQSQAVTRNGILPSQEVSTLPNSFMGGTQHPPSTPTD
ncbi:hypothetical protein BDZ94DRAFT_407328 [Collybia nuda]|uniref:Uncharacterized protein n=1 Tax=Collybia nuda TaxID=64659 RepID=A0A9P5Y9F6_9AGAR|nr:hypothetical protein BDZ94DRAFT_407328 [Collybia nuda]